MHLITLDQNDHHVLRNSAKTVLFPLSQEIKIFIASLKDFVKALKSPHGKPAGLAATQVGEPLRIFAMQIPEEAKQIRKDVYDIFPLTVWINPSYFPIESEDKILDWEGCYSVPDKMGEVYRYKAVRYEAYLENGEKVSGVARGLMARIIQHEVGHLNGELYVDLLKENCRFGSLEAMWEIRQREMKGI